jgi:hypothetical protein
MAKTKTVDPAAVLSKSIEKALVRRRNEGAEYPAPLREVAREAAGESAEAVAVAADVSEANIWAALQKLPSKTRCVLAIDGDLDSLAILNEPEDIERLAGDARLLQRLSERLCSPQQPVISVKDLAQSGLLAKRLSKPFLTIWAARVKSGELPGFVQSVTIPGKTARLTENKLHDLRFPLPWLTLSRDLLQALKQADGPLVEWSTLAETIPPGTPPTYLDLARLSEPFQSAVIPVFAKEPNGWLVLADQANRIGSDSRLFERLYRAALKSGDTAIDAATLKKQKLLNPAAAPAFLRSVDQMLVGQGLPPEIGMVRIGAKAFLFRLADLPGSTGHDNRPTSHPVLTPVTTAAPAADLSPRMTASPTVAGAVASDKFAESFRDAFDRIDAREGGYNFVKLLQLRTELRQVPRAEFDAGLLALRKDRLYSLESSEGHVVTLSEQEREAGILEAGRLLIYCKRVRTV